MTTPHADVDYSISVYRNGIAKTLYSQCKWFPSDSTYTSIAQKKCGVLTGTMLGFARFMNEQDAAYMGYPTVHFRNHLNFVDLPNECTL